MQTKAFPTSELWVVIPVKPPRQSKQRLKDFSTSFRAGLAFAMLQVGRGGSLIELAAPVSLLGVFALDLVVAILRRLLNARPLFEGDRSHIYDQLVDRGLSVPTVALLAGAGEATVATIALAVDNWFTGVAVLVKVGSVKET